MISLIYIISCLITFGLGIVYEQLRQRRLRLIRAVAILQHEAEQPPKAPVSLQKWDAARGDKTLATKAEHRTRVHLRSTHGEHPVQRGPMP